MDNALAEIRPKLLKVTAEIRQGHIGRAERRWRGADVLISPDQPERVEGGFYPEPRRVETPFALELSWLFEQLRDMFYEVLTGASKIEFYGRLANAANRYLEREPTGDVQALLLAVTQEAARMLEEMSRGEFRWLGVAPGNLIWDDIVYTAADRLQRDYPALVVSAEARHALVQRVNEHQEAADLELLEGRATPKSISDAAYKQLLDSVDPERLSPALPHEPLIIRPRDVHASMARRCHWIPWC